MLFYHFKLKLFAKYSLHAGLSNYYRKTQIRSAECRVNECMEFPGAGTEYISVRELNYTEGIPELTLAVWIKTPQRGLIASWDRSDYFRFAAGDAAIEQFDYVAFDICCPIEDWHGDIKVTDDNWHHVSATYDGEMKRIYVDGEVDVEQPTSTTGNMIGVYNWQHDWNEITTVWIHRGRF